MTCKAGDNEERCALGSRQQFLLRGIGNITKKEDRRRKGTEKMCKEYAKNAEAFLSFFFAWLFLICGKTK